jgi:foldase protein PrsA
VTLPRRSAGILIAVLALSACGLGRPEVARVGDQDVGEEELRTAVAVQRTLADLQGVPCGQSSDGESEAAACQRFALSGELLWLAVSGYAESNQLGASESDVEVAVGQLETQVGPEVLDRALGEHDLTRDDLVELGRRILTIREVRNTVAGERVGNEELRTLYRERSVEFAVVQVNHILVETEAEARRVYRRVRDATEARFIQVAREVSIEPGAEERGGQLGSAAASSFAPEFANAAVALAPGEVSEPVQTQFGWHVIYLVDKEVTPFEEARAGLLEPLADREFRGWLEERADALGVEVNPRFGRFVAESFSVEPVRSTDPEGDGGAQQP